MESLGSFSGIISGFDFRTLVDQIIQLERRPADRLQSRIDSNNNQSDALGDLKSILSDLSSAAKGLRDGSAFQTAATTVSGQTTGGANILSASAGTGVAPGSYQVEVLSLAKAEKLSSKSFSDSTTALNLSGEFFVNGKRIAVETFDTLNDIRDKLTTSAGGDSGITASILSNGTASSTLILTSKNQGATGINLVDGTEGLLQSLGIVDSSTTVKKQTSSGAESDRFTSDTTNIKTLRGLTAATGSTTVTIGGQSVSIDLANESLTDIATNISALTGVTATVQSETDADGNTSYYLDVTGTTSFSDSGHVLEILGIVEGGRSATNHSVQGNVFTDSDGSTPATSSTLLTNIFNGGSNAGVQVGDTFTITGTRGDGTTVSLSHTVAGGDTLGTLLTKLNNSTDGFGSGSRTATASIDASGRLVLADDTSGSSLLSLSIVANNEGGGTLDFGSFGVKQDGYSRQVTAGADSTFRVDGINFTRASNSVSDAIPDITLSLLAAEAGSTASIVVERSAASAVAAAKDVVDKFNTLTDFITSQRAAPGQVVTTPPLAADSMLRVISSSLTSILVGTIGGLDPNFSRLSVAGIEIDKEGHLTFDSAKLEDLYATNFEEVQQLFGETGATSTSQLEYLGSSASTAAGTYNVNITTAASQATVTGSGFSGTYADDGTADTMTVTDTVGFAASVSLTNGMTTSDIVNALNTQFAATAAHQLDSDTTLYSDAGATTQINEATLLQDLFDSGGTNAAVANGDTIGYTGTTVGGTSFAQTFTVTDTTTDTVGDLISDIQSAMGTNATVTISGGKIRIVADDPGLSQMTLTVTANNEGGGTLNFGTVSTTTAGKGVMALTASSSGNEVVITHSEYGSVEGFDVAYTAGGADGTAQLGVAASSYRGVDVVGTIGGFAATGSGQTLVGDSGTTVDGLQVVAKGTGTGALGTVTLTLGAASLLERTLDIYTSAGDGIIDLRTTGLEDRITSLENRLDNVEQRLELRRKTLLERFTAMEVLIGQLSQQQQSFAQQVGSLSTLNTGRNG